MRIKDYIQVAGDVYNTFNFSYIAPKEVWIMKCAKHLREWHERREVKFSDLSIVAKHYYISNNNENYDLCRTYHQKTGNVTSI